jgi:predicted MFS family arabinose efflux permease
VTVALAGLLLAVVRDPKRLTAEGDSPLRGLWTVMRLPALRLILPLMICSYAVSAGIRGSWAGPYLADIHGMDAIGIGQATLWMALTMAIGNFIAGPLAQRLGQLKWVVLPVNVAGALCALALATMTPGPATSVILIASIGLFGATYALLMTHARSFMPVHLTGRGITLMNFFIIGGVGMGQFITARLHTWQIAANGSQALAYDVVFGYYGGALMIALFIYGFSRNVRG